MFRALGCGLLAGAVLSIILGWAFVKGCPIFDVEHDPIHPF